jgi:imidazolonepropionase-like amidohydrolase
VAAHAQSTRSIADAVAAGVRSIEHGYAVDDATTDMMGERGVFLVPTLATLTRSDGDATRSRSETPERRERLHRFRELARERLHAAISSGIPVAMGTDAGIVEHGHNLREVALLVRFGCSPMRAIMAGTSAAARLLGLADEVGALLEGRRADLIVLRADPLAQPEVFADLDAVGLVMRHGVVVRAAAEFCPVGFHPGHRGHTEEAR